VIWRGCHHLHQMKLWRFRNTSGICGGVCRHGILAVVLLYITEAKALAAGYLLAGFLCLWCHIVVEVVGRFCGLVAEAMGVVEWAFVVKVEVAMGGGCVACMLDRTEALASVPISEECQLHVKALLVLPFLY
jgi:hypothetical protein